MRPRFQISINALRHGASAWGDLAFARGLAAAMARQGVEATLFFRDEQPPDTAPGAVVLRIIGPHLPGPVAGLANMVWVISPPNLAPVAALRRYQAVYVASRPLAAAWAAQGVAAAHQDQATDTRHFHPGRADGPALGAVFVGARASRAPRRLVIAAIEAGAEVQVWGPGWAGAIPPRLWVAPRLDHEGLAALYARAAVVINDHMPPMARAGMMSNRSFDALACGAAVISDRVAGFDAPDLPWLVQTGPEAVAGALARALAGPNDAATRAARHAAVAGRHGFDAVAARFIADAARMLADGARAAPAFAPGHGAAMPRLRDPAQSGADQAAATLAAADAIAAILDALPARAAPPAPSPTQGVIHPLMADLRAAQAMADGTPPDPARAEALATRARRLRDARDAAWLRDPARGDALAVAVINDQPLWDHRPPGLNREGAKAHVRVWARARPVALARPVGVFVHLRDPAHAAAIAQALARIDAPRVVYATTQGAAAVLGAALPDARIATTGRGRDAWGNLYAWGAAWGGHDLALCLTDDGDWRHDLACLLADGPQINRIVSWFQDIAPLGLVMPVASKPGLDHAHWAASRDIAAEIAHRAGITAPLPGDEALRFPLGGAFWARAAALRPLTDLRLSPAHFPPERGQRAATLAHALRRMVAVSCAATGHHAVAVAPHGAGLFPRHAKQFSKNRDLRDFLAARPPV